MCRLLRMSYPVCKTVQGRRQGLQWHVPAFLFREWQWYTYLLHRLLYFWFPLGYSIRHVLFHRRFAASLHSSSLSVSLSVLNLLPVVSGISWFLFASPGHLSGGSGKYSSYAWQAYRWIYKYNRWWRSGGIHPASNHGKENGENLLFRQRAETN